jgi:hypothetical protein
MEDTVLQAKPYYTCPPGHAEEQMSPGWRASQRLLDKQMTAREALEAFLTPPKFPELGEMSCARIRFRRESAFAMRICEGGER